MPTGNNAECHEALNTGYKAHCELGVTQIFLSSVNIMLSTTVLLIGGFDTKMKTRHTLI